jgi:UDP-N-acetylmuramyl pentapeptide phosphotransferase/UDP-N-acetylglucosamine-1-phosphate transferase
MSKLQELGYHQAIGADLISNFFLAILLGAIATALSWGLMRALGRLDQPDARRTHKQATPRAGALGIALICLVYALQQGGAQLWLIPALAALGLLDDLFAQSALLRLTLQLAFCTIAVVAQGDPWPDGPVLIIRILLTLSAVAIINAANFFDGRNGLLSSNFILLLLCLPLLGVHWPAAGLWLGFLPFNFPRARIFMGDVGSYCIGATLAWLWLCNAQNSSTSSMAFLVACSGILADPILTLLLRLHQGKKIWQAHREHLYQWLARTGCSDLKLVSVYLVYAGLSILLARFMLMQTDGVAALLTCAWCAASALFWGQARRSVLRSLRQRQSVGRA